jgi:hypothetical protein
MEWFLLREDLCVFGSYWLRFSDLCVESLYRRGIDRVGRRRRMAREHL